MLTVSECKDRIELEIAKVPLSEKSPVELYEPINYILQLGGKRIRPVLTLLACNLFSEDIENAMNPALAIEIFHNFTLLHDDIMDHAEMRRNHATVHTKWNENIAIISGDAMNIIAYQYLCNTSPEIIPELLSVFSKTALEICEGQQLDMNFETRNDVSILEYSTMIKLKTAVLLATSLKIGAICAKAPQKDKEKLYDFGLNLGMAFQIQDDLLDTFGNQDEFGKSIGGDILARKKTFLYLKALELSNPNQKSQLYQLYSEKFISKEKLIQNVIAIYKELELLKISQNTVEEYTQKAMVALNSIDASKESLLILQHLALNIMNRKV
jgi:geranylgeranyl diphosphate synthase, type II